MKNAIRFLILIILCLPFISYDIQGDNSSKKELHTFNKQLFPKLDLDTILHSYLDSISMYLLDCEVFIQDSFYVEVKTKYNSKMDYLIFDVELSEGSLELPNKDFKVYGSLLINKIQFVFIYYSDSLLPPPKYINNYAKLCSDSLEVLYHYYYDLSLDERLLFKMWPICEKCKEQNRILYSKEARAVLYSEICFSSQSKIK